MNLNTNKKIIYFRFDAGGLIGFGHWGRIESIAEACEELNIEPILVIRKRPSLKNFDSKFKTIWLSELSDVTTAITADWINHNDEQEFEDFINCVPAADCVFVDHYGLGIDYFNKLKRKGIKTISIHDFKKENIVEDMVVNYNAGSEFEEKTYQQLNRSTHFLLGVSYAPIKKKIREKHVWKNNSNEIKNIGVYLGGIPLKMLESVLDLVSGVDYFKDKKIKWIVNNGSDLERLQLMSRNSSIEFLSRVNSMDEFYDWTDLIIGACGVSYLERAVVGVPQVLFKVADNQREIVDYLIRNQLGFFVGDLRHDSIIQMKEKLKNIDNVSLIKYAKDLFEKIDGYGPKRIVEEIKRSFFNVED